MTSVLFITRQTHVNVFRVNGEALQLNVVYVHTALLLKLGHLANEEMFRGPSCVHIREGACCFYATKAGNPSQQKMFALTVRGHGCCLKMEVGGSQT